MTQFTLKQSPEGEKIFQNICTYQMKINSPEKKMDNKILVKEKALS